MHLLYIQSSPRGRGLSPSPSPTRSSKPIARSLPSSWSQVNVWEENLPEFDQEAIGAKYKGINNEPMDPAEAAVWDKIQELAARFQQADRIVLGVPMWNFAYPYKLKQLIDLACQRNMLFTYDGNEYGPLLKTPRAFVVYARGGTYAEDSPTPASRFDHQKGYIDFWLKFIGVKEVHTLVVEGTTWGGEREEGREHRAWSGGGKKVGGRFLKVASHWSLRRTPNFPVQSFLCESPTLGLLLLDSPPQRFLTAPESDGETLRVSRWASSTPDPTPSAPPAGLRAVSMPGLNAPMLPRIARIRAGLPGSGIV